MRDQNGRKCKDFSETFREYSMTGVWVLVGLWVTLNLFLATRRSSSLLQTMNNIDGKILSRNKRFIFMDNERRLSLPTGSILALSGVLSLPFLGNLPIGYGSGLTIAVPLTIKFDDLGLTSEDNRFGYFDFLNFTGYFDIPQLNMSAMRPPSLLFPDRFPTQFEQNIQNIFIPRSRTKRSLWKSFPGVNYAGGDREMVFQIVEDIVSSFSVDGQACVLRAICEMHEQPLFNYGFFGEMLNVLLSPSLAAFAEYRLGPYLEAENHGKQKRECSRYHSKCKYSMFTPKSLHRREHSDLNFTSYEDNLISDETRNGSHHRQKRIISFGPQRRLFFPPSTAVVGTPTLNLPFLRDLPDGYSSQLSYSVPFSLDFDGLGLTSILNTFGNIPFLKRKRKRDTQESHAINYAGGDREIMFAVVADSLTNIGMRGEACLLRAICEIHEVPFLNHGLFGEFLQLFLTPSQAPFARKRLYAFVKAEQLGKNCGDCSAYYSECSKSLFTNPGAGTKFRNSTEIGECKRRHALQYREVNMNFVKSTKSKFKKVKKKSKPSLEFLKEIVTLEERKKSNINVIRK